MTQYSLVEAESKKRGAKRTIKLPAILAGKMLQYTRNHGKLKQVIREFGYFNQLTVINTGAVNIEIALDFTEEKTYPIPATSTISLDEIMYQEFNITNLDGAAATVKDKITVIATYESPLARERMKKFIQIGGR